MKKLGISHITSSPHHPKSHGFIERMVSTIENFMKKSDDLDAPLLNFRCTPFEPQMPSPSENLFGRKIWSNLPIHTRGFLNSSQRQFIEHKQQKLSDWYNAHSRELPELQLNQPVFFQDVAWKTWGPGIHFWLIEFLPLGTGTSVFILYN